MCLPDDPKKLADKNHFAYWRPSKRKNCPKYEFLLIFFKIKFLTHYYPLMSSRVLLLDCLFVLFIFCQVSVILTSFFLYEQGWKKHLGLINLLPLWFTLNHILKHISKLQTDQNCWAFEFLLFLHEVACHRIFLKFM